MAGLLHLPSEPEPQGSVMLHFQSEVSSFLPVFHLFPKKEYPVIHLQRCQQLLFFFPDLFDAQYAANLIIHRIRIQRFCLEFQVSVLIEFQCQDTADLLSIHHTEDLQFFFYLLWQGVTGKWFRGKRIANPNTHGTGCTLSSAIASNLAKGYDLETAVRRAKAYISGALAAMLDLGHGSGPMNHAFALDNEWSKEAEA